MDREAAYLIKDYIDPRDHDEIIVEYDPLPPWCLSGTTRHAADYPHVVLDLGAGLGAVGFAIAESLQSYRERSRPMAPERLPRSGLSNSDKASAHPDVVVLTDLEDVCDTLLNPNLLHMASLWSARTDVQMAISHREWRRGSTPRMHEPNGYEPATGVPGVQVAVRPLPWGSMQDVVALASSLAPYQNTNTVFTIVCSDLVRTFPLKTPGSDLLSCRHRILISLTRCISPTSWHLSYALSFT